MGAFDVLVVSQKCDQCGIVADFRYQFKYGTPWQKQYVLGDRVDWEGNPNRWNGQPMPGLIAVDAEREACPNCQCEYEFSIVYIDDGTFIGAGRNGGRFNFGNDDYALPIGQYARLTVEDTK